MAVKLATQTAPPPAGRFDVDTVTVYIDPAHAPLQPVNVQPAEGVAVSRKRELDATGVEQVAAQLRLAGLEVTVPDPLTCTVSGNVKVAVQV